MYFQIKAPRLFDAETMAMMFTVNAFVFMILYSLSGHVLSNAFGKFQAKLWKVVEESNDDEFASAMSMVTYSNKYPVVVTLKPFNITEKKAVLSFLMCGLLLI